MIYAMSDIHGCIGQLEEMLKLTDLTGDNKIIFLGDYIDYGYDSGEVLRKIQKIQCEYGEEKVIVLKGNHEAMFLEWIDDFSKELTEEDKDLIYDTWLTTDEKYGYNTLKTLIRKESLDRIKGITDFADRNMEAVKLVKEENRELINWMQKMPLFYETEPQIFIHAGVDEEAGEYWKWGSDENMFLGKIPPSKGQFIKTLIAGHIGTSSIARDRDFHDIYFDGKSHYYIDGSVYSHGKLNLLCYDEKTCDYRQIEAGSTPKKITPYI
ncbi:MAG: metallophosphoesterase [Clostridiales bacterium]|nr:metallophosphoesterase [Clostridiales bacterium]